MQYNEVIGQEEIKARLRQELKDGRVPHALLIETLTDEGAGTMVVPDMEAYHEKF